MNLLNKLTIKNLKLNKKRTIVTIIGIMLSVALITAVSTLYSSAISSLIKFETNEKGYYHVAFYDVLDKDMSIFENNKKIEEIYLTKNIGYAKLENSKNEYKPYAFVKAFTKDSLENLSVKLVKGKLPENENEILIPTHLKTNGRITLNVGDTITLDVGKRVSNDGYELTQNNPYTPSDKPEEKVDPETGDVTNSTYNESSEDIVDTETKTYKIVGIIERPATNIEGYSAPGYTFITYMNNNDIKGNVDVFAKYTEDGVKDSYKVTAGLLGVDEEIFERVYSGNYVPDTNEEKDLKELDKAKYQFNINTYLIILQTNPFADGAVGSLGVVVFIVCAIIIFTSVFCIKNSFDISITEKIKQYGMLRSIGATKRQIKKNVFYEATILGLIGIPLGILLGFIASFLLIIISNYFLKDMVTEGLKLEFSISLIAILVSIILGIVTIYFSAFRSAKRASKVTPIDSIRNSANIKIKSKKLRSPKIIKKIFGMGGEISFKNLKRNKKKYRTTVISIVVSVFVFIALSSFMSMAFGEVERQLQLSDYNISLSTNSIDEESYKKFIETTKLDNIDNYTIYRNSEIQFMGNYYNKEYIDFLKLELDPTKPTYISIIAIGEEQFNKYIKSLGYDYNYMKDEAILVDSDIIKTYDENNNEQKKYMRIFNFNKGDTIEAKLSSNLNEIEIKIGTIAEEKPFGLKNRYGRFLVISDEFFDSITISNSLNIYYESSNADKLQNDLDDYLKNESYELYNIDENAKMMNNLYTLIGIFLYGFIIVISLIGITNIFNTITTNMALRKQEFAMLKSVGMTSKEFNRMIRLESIFMGVKALLFGIPIGLFLSYLIYHFLVKGSGVSYSLPITAILIAICAVFILIILIMKYSMNKINKQNTIETIRNENI